MKTLHISKPDPFYRQLVNATFPGYKGKTFSLITVDADHEFDCLSCWGGGSRDYYRLVNMVTLDTRSVGGDAPVEFGGRRDQFTLPENFALVEHSIFCGKDMGIAIYVTEVNATKLLPETTEDVSENEKIVLAFTRSLKNTYSGRKHIRYSEAHGRYGITREDWKAAQSTLVEKGLLRKNNSITPEGRNVDTGSIRY